MQASAIEAVNIQRDSNGVQKKVLSQHRVHYSDPFLDTKYRSAAKFNPRGMQHVYTITHFFLDLIQRQDVLPASVNITEFFNAPPHKLPQVLERHKEEILLQYIGVLTVAICGILAAIAIPIAGFCVCCCRCAGKCGGYPEHFDKRGDACRRVCLGVLLSIFTVAAMFGAVSAFVTNQYTKEGVQTLPERLRYAADDTGMYFKNTGEEVHWLLVKNFEELKDVLFKILDESGDILERNLAREIQAVTMDNLTDTLGDLGEVKTHLVTIQNRTLDLQEKVRQLELGLQGSKKRLKAALRQCGDSPACSSFLRDHNIDIDLNIAEAFVDIPFELPDVSLLMKDISELVKVQVTVDVERSIGDIRPSIKKEIKKMGIQLSEKSAEIQNVLNEFDGSLTVVRNDIPRQKPALALYGGYLYYIGFGMACMVLLILCCHILGLFYGFCGKRPGNIYGDDCCNTGTGANWLLAGIYLTFMFSMVLLLATTAHFLVGSTIEKVACDALNHPQESDIVRLVDERYMTPLLKSQLRQSNVEGAGEIETSLRQLIQQCHNNQTLYVILQTERFYDVQELKNWKETFGFNAIIDDLTNKITTADLQNIQLLSPQAEQHLKKLADSKISDLNFSQYTELFERQITEIDLASFIDQLEQVQKRLGRSTSVRLALQNEVLFLRNMAAVVDEMRAAMFELQSSVDVLEKRVDLNKANFRKSLRQVIGQATKAPEFLRAKGPKLVKNLANKYIEEAVELIDVYVDRVISKTQNSIGQCHPVSLSFNATVNALCKEIVDPFNGFWASCGWCFMLYLPSIAVALALVSLYRKSEPYPGPLVENHHDDGPTTGSNHHRPSHGRGGSGNNKKGKKRHRRNPSEYLPDSAHHYRAGYSYQADCEANNRFQDVAPRNYTSGSSIVQTSAAVTQAAPSTASTAAPGEEQPPRYISNPNLVNLEYERPPPYYYPGASAPVSTDNNAPPPLPPPNRP